MADTYTSLLNLVKPGASSTDWAAKVNGNFDLVDGLESRVAYLESLHGTSGVPNYWVLPTGSAWADVLSAVTGASAGDTIILPPEEIVQTSTLRIDKSLRLLGNPLGGSSLLAADTVTDPDFGGGSNIRIGIGNFSAAGSAACDGVRLAYFEMRDARTNINQRNQAINVIYACKNVEIDHMTFTDITSDCIDIRPWAWNSTDVPSNWYEPLYGCTNISIHDNVVNEWWEGFFDYNNGTLENCWVYNNSGVVTNNPHGLTFQGPMALEINIEQQGGQCSNVYMMNNSFYASGTGGQQGSIGFVENGGDGVPNNIFYKNVYCLNNIFDGFYTGLYIGQAPHWTFTYPASTDQHNYTLVSDCQFTNCVAQSLYVWPNSSEPGWRSCDEWDQLIIRNSTFTGGSWSIDQSRVTYPMIVDYSENVTHP
jgi:hypothetical protein